MMNLRYYFLGTILTIALLLSFFSLAASQDDPGFIINRMVLGERIADREPVSVGDTFSAEAEKIYCFLEAKNIQHDTSVSFVWYYGDTEMARVSLPLRKGLRWRTYSSKKLAGLTGNWKVELLGSSGIVLKSVSFRVE